MAKDFGMRRDINKWNVCDVTPSNITRHKIKDVLLSKIPNRYTLFESYDVLLNYCISYYVPCFDSYKKNLNFICKILVNLQIGH